MQSDSLVWLWSLMCNLILQSDLGQYNIWQFLFIFLWFFHWVIVLSACLRVYLCKKCPLDKEIIWPRMNPKLQIQRNSPCVCHPHTDTHTNMHRKNHAAKCWTKTTHSYIHTHTHIHSCAWYRHSDRIIITIIMPELAIREPENNVFQLNSSKYLYACNANKVSELFCYCYVLCVVLFALSLSRVYFLFSVCILWVCVCVVCMI